MVKAVLGILLLSVCPATAAQRLDLAAWAVGLPVAFEVHGTKAEPTYEETIDIVRVGDAVTVTGGAPAWAARAVETAQVSAAGALCLGTAPCAAARSTSGFLATAALVAASRRHGLSGSVQPRSFGDRQVVCVPGEQLGTVEPILDPCFDRLSGAAIAERHRLTGAFDGPTLDPSSLRIAIPAPLAAQRQTP